MTLLTTVPEYRTLAAIPDATARRRAWLEEYEAAHGDVFDLYYTRWGHPDRRDAAADAAPGLLPLVERREAHMRELLRWAPEQLGTLGVRAAPVDTVLMVGGHSSNGWVTRFRDRTALFIALEYLTDGPGDEVLAVHEWLHAVQDQHAGSEAWPETVATGLFCEGLAVAVTRLLLPGAPDSRYLWFDDEHGAWVAECAASGARIRELAAAHLDETQDAPAVAGFFTGAKGWSLPIRCGYWLGDALITRVLESGTPLPELLALTADDAAEVVRAGL